MDFGSCCAVALSFICKHEISDFSSQTPKLIPIYGYK